MGEIVTVNFRSDELYGFKHDDGTFIALKPIVEGMGLSWNGQRERVNRDPILSEGARMIRVPFGRGGAQDTLCLKFELLNGWLFTIDSSRIKNDEVRERVILYQRECYGVLFEHFYKGEKGLPGGIDLDEDKAEPEQSRVRLVTEARQTFGNHAAGQLWFTLGLPIVPAMMEGKPQMDLLSYNQIKTVDQQSA